MKKGWLPGGFQLDETWIFPAIGYVEKARQKSIGDQPILTQGVRITLFIP
jgi:hypothetical protein